jgi:hypothetical protein
MRRHSERPQRGPYRREDIVTVLDHQGTGRRLRQPVDLITMFTQHARGGIGLNFYLPPALSKQMHQ